MKLRAALLLCACVLATACSAARPAPPTPEDRQRLPPDLTGRSVFVVPSHPAIYARRSAQSGEVVPGLDAEIEFWLRERGSRVDWTFPAEIERALNRNPSIGVRIDALPVDVFSRAEIINIGDPLLGDLRRVGALVDARWALIPVAVGYAEPAPESGETAGRIEIAAALIDTVGGRVLWYGVVASQRGAQGDAGLIASAAQTFAEAVLP